MFQNFKSCSHAEIQDFTVPLYRPFPLEIKDIQEYVHDTIPKFGLSFFFLEQWKNMHVKVVDNSITLVPFLSNVCDCKESDRTDILYDLLKDSFQRYDIKRYSTPGFNILNLLVDLT